MAQVLLHRVRKTFGGALALKDVSLEIASGEFLTLLGPSGCGKSTTLRAVAGLADIDAGRIVIGERDVTRVPVQQRDIGMVFQNLALFPHMTVAENVAFGLKMRGVARPERTARVGRALDLVRLSDLAGRYPHQLSGGQQQRVAIARALIVDPGVLLLDEPFSALDRKLREEMQGELRDLTRRLGITAVFVTHDQEEALTLSDRVAVMNAGAIEQLGAPGEIYMRPGTRFVAEFMGVGNLLRAAPIGADDGRVAFVWKGVRLEPAAGLPPKALEGGCTLALRPDLIRLAPEAGDGALANAAAGRVLSRVDHGAFATIEVAVGHENDARLTVRRPKVEEAATGPLAAGDPVMLTWEARHVVVLAEPAVYEADAAEATAPARPLTALTPELSR